MFTMFTINYNCLNIAAVLCKPKESINKLMPQTSFRNSYTSSCKNESKFRIIIDFLGKQRDTDQVKKHIDLTVVMRSGFAAHSVYS